MQVMVDKTSLHNDQAQTLYTVFLPLTKNGGGRQPLHLLRRIERDLVQRAGGLTRYAQGQGLWVPPTARPLCRDRVLPVHLVLANDPQSKAWLLERVADIAQLLKQDQIFVFAQPVWLLAR